MSSRQNNSIEQKKEDAPQNPALNESHGELSESDLSSVSGGLQEASQMESRKIIIKSSSLNRLP